MKLIQSKKGVALLAVLAIAVISAVGAYAYFTASGTGTGTATVGSTTAWTVTPNAISGALYPGQGSDPATGEVKNNSNGNQKLFRIDATVIAPTVAALAPAGDQACSASDFALEQTDGTSLWVIDSPTTAHLLVGHDLAKTGFYDWTGLNVKMVDGSTNQDNCQGATVNVKFDAS